MGASSVDQLDRRRAVERLYAEGLSAPKIAESLGVDARTIRKDLELLAVERAHDLDLGWERARLLEAGKHVEDEAWSLFDRLPDADVAGRLGSLSKVLAAQERVAKVVGDIAGADVERRLAALERQMKQVEAEANER
jgi:uncharacterized protein YjcR